MSKVTIAILAKEAEQKRGLKMVVEAVYKERIIKAFHGEESIKKLADAYVKTNGIDLERLFCEVALFDDEDEEVAFEELYRREKRKFEAEFLKKHVKHLEGKHVADWLATEAALEVVYDPDLTENRKLMEGIGADPSIEGIKAPK